MKPKLEIIKADPRIIFDFDPRLFGLPKLELVRAKDYKRKRKFKGSFRNKKFFTYPSRA